MKNRKVWISFLFYLLFAIVGLSAISVLIELFVPDYSFMTLTEILVASVIVAFFSTWGKIFRSKAYKRGESDSEKRDPDKST
jgi:uncharacterized membrane protein